jgi:hypothetical protein
VSERRLSAFLKAVKGKQLIVFGAGPTARDFLVRAPIHPAYLLDNDANIWGEKVQGFEVRSPDTLSEAEPGRCAVVICSSAIEEIAPQLEGYGLKRDRDYFISPFLLPDGKPEGAEALLVTAIGKNGGIWRLDLAEETQTRLHEGDCRGLVKVPGGYIAALEHEGFLMLDNDLAEVRRIKVAEDQNFHGLAHDPDLDVIYVNETAFDRIGIYRLDDMSRVSEIGLGRHNEPMEQHHINDIAFGDGRLLVSMFSIKGVWRNEQWDDGVVAEVDPATGTVKKILIDGLSQPHSVLPDDGHVYVCNSMDCQLLRDGELICQMQGYLRGVARADDTFFIGQSEIRRLSRFSDRFTNVSLDSGVHAWNMDERTSRFTKLPVGGVFDILTLPTDGTS